MSLCRVFWSLAAWLPFVLSWRLLCRAAAAWSRWTFTDLDKLESPGPLVVLRAFFRSLTLPAAFSVALYLLSVDRYFVLPFVIALLLWVATFTITGTIFLIEWIRGDYGDTVLGEATSFVSTGIRAAKAKVCPIITFEPEERKA